MLLKLLTLVALAHQINACCLPESFQVTVLSETTYHDGQTAGRFRAQIVMAVNASEGRAAMLITDENGQRSGAFADFRARRAFAFAEGHGCFESSIEGIAEHLNASRCIPPQLFQRSPIRLTLAEGLNANFFSGVVPGGPGSNGTHIDAMVSDHCLPILVKVSDQSSFVSTNFFGNFSASPEGRILNLPAECRNATTGGRKRGAFAFAYGTTPFVL